MSTCGPQPTPEGLVDGLASGAEHAQPVPLIDLQAAHRALRAQLREAFERVLASGTFAAGPEVASFEHALAQRVGAAHAVGVASGTAALHLAMVAAGIGRGDEVIIPANTFVATAEAVFAAGATPVVVDVVGDTAAIDPNAVEAAITPRTAAIVAVHLYGLPADVDALSAVARRAGLLLIEDAAQALGAAWRGRPVGSLTDVAAFSFYPTKNLGALGEGGAVSTNSAELAARVARLRNHGEEAKNVHVELGFNERLHELQAAFLRVKLAHLDEDLRRRALAARSYRERLDPTNAMPLRWPPGATPAHHLYVVRVAQRDGVLHALRRQGIEAAVHYPTPIHQQPACQGVVVADGHLGNVETLAGMVLSLPFHPTIAPRQIQRCVESLVQAMETARRERLR